MSCYYGDTPEERHRMIEAGRKWLAEASPLPDAIKLADPFVVAFEEFFYAIDGRASAMLFDLENGTAYHDEATELVNTVEQVCSIVRSAVRGKLAGDNLGSSFDTDRILRAIANTETLVDSLNMRAVYGDEGVAS